MIVRARVQVLEVEGCCPGEEEEEEGKTDVSWNLEREEFFSKNIRQNGF